MGLLNALCQDEPICLEATLHTELTPHSKPILATIGILFLIGYTIDYNSQYLSLCSLASADIRLFAIAPP
jgi:hypothetical protein